MDDSMKVDKADIEDIISGGFYEEKKDVCVFVFYCFFRAVLQ
jgi:hypothetical protein